MAILQKNSRGQTLYAVAYERLNARGDITSTDVHYLHADDVRHAEVCFRSAHSKQCLAGRIHIAAVGPAIGFHVEDNHGEILHA